jgi:hypothetical protein
MFNSSYLKEENVDNILENETQQNKIESWNKLNKTVKIEKLYDYADKYCSEHKYSGEEIQVLKQFFVESLERGKLLKTKEVNYNKNSQQIIDIQGLHYYSNTHKFTLKNMDAKRVSTLKSLTPKRAICINGASAGAGAGKVVLLEETKI